jgi:hypothetical protein
MKTLATLPDKSFQRRTFASSALFSRRLNRWIYWTALMTLRT